MIRRDLILVYKHVCRGGGAKLQFPTLVANCNLWVIADIWGKQKVSSELCSSWVVSKNILHFRAGQVCLHTCQGTAVLVVPQLCKLKKCPFLLLHMSEGVITINKLKWALLCLVKTHSTYVFIIIVISISTLFLY